MGKSARLIHGPRSAKARSRAGQASQRVFGFNNDALSPVFGLWVASTFDPQFHGARQSFRVVGHADGVRAFRQSMILSLVARAPFIQWGQQEQPASDGVAVVTVFHGNGGNRRAVTLNDAD